MSAAELPAAEPRRDFIRDIIQAEPSTSSVLWRVIILCSAMGAAPLMWQIPTDAPRVPLRQIAPDALVPY